MVYKNIFHFSVFLVNMSHKSNLAAKRTKMRTFDLVCTLKYLYFCPIILIKYFFNKQINLDTMKKVALVVVALGLGIFKAGAQEEQAIAVENESRGIQSVVVKIIDDLKESTRVQHEISRQNFAAEKEAYRVRHEKATEPNPEFLKFLQAEGFKGKYNAVVEDLKASCREHSEPNPELQRFLQAEGLKGKYNVVVEDVREGCQKAKQNRNQ